MSGTNLHGTKDIQVIEVQLSLNKYTGAGNMKTQKLLDCTIIEICTVIRSNTVRPISIAEP